MSKLLRTYVPSWGTAEQQEALGSVGAPPDTGLPIMLGAGLIISEIQIDVRGRKLQRKQQILVWPSA